MTTLTSKLILSLVDRATAPARTAAAAVGRLRDAANRNARQMQVMRGRVLDAAAVGYTLARALTRPIRAAMEFESAMADVNKVVNFTEPGGLLKMSKAILNMSTAIPIAATGIAEIVAAAGQAGMQGDELLVFAEMAAKVGVAFDIAAGETGESLAKIKTALDLTVAQTGDLADAMNHLSNTSASSAPDLLNYMRRVGAVGKQYGFTKEQTVAIGSAMIAAGAKADVAATSFRNMGKALVRGTGASARQLKAFKKLGLGASEVARRMQQDAVGTMNDVIARIRALPKEIQASTISDLFGDEARAIMPLIENVNLLEQSLKAVADKTNFAGSAQAEYAIRAETSANKLQLFQNKIEKMSIAIGSSLLPAVVQATEVMGPMVAAITQFAEANPALVSNVAMAVTALIGLKVATIGLRFAFLFVKGGLIDFLLIIARTVAGLLSLINPLNLIKAAFVGLRAALMATGIGAIVVGLAMAGMWIYNNWSGLKAMFAGIGEVLSTAFGNVGPLFQPLIDALGWIGDKMSGLTGTMDVSAEQWRAFGQDVGRSIVSWVEHLQTFVAAVVALPGKIAGAFGDLITDMAQIGRRIMDALLDGLKAGAEAVLDYVANIGSRIKSRISGAVSGAVSSLKGMVGLGGGAAVDGAKAAGGPIVGGRTYLVGEEGPELITPSKSGYVHTAGETSQMFGGATARSVSAGLAQISFGDIIIQGVQDAEAIAAELEDRIRERLAGLQADSEWAVG